MLHLGICRTTALALASSMTLLCLSPAAAAEGIDDAGSPAARVDAAPAAPAQKPTHEESPNRPSFDPVSERIKYLHDRLRITRAQEPLWDNVAQVMRENADAVAPLYTTSSKVSPLQ
jgi:hypothetical protein